MLPLAINSTGCDVAGLNQDWVCNSGTTCPGQSGAVPYYYTNSSNSILLYYHSAGFWYAYDGTEYARGSADPTDCITSWAMSGDFSSETPPTFTVTTPDTSVPDGDGTWNGSAADGDLNNRANWTTGYPAAGSGYAAVIPASLSSYPSTGTAACSFANAGTISGGTWTGAGTNTGSITGGTFASMANNEAGGGRITGGTFTTLTGCDLYFYNASGGDIATVGNWYIDSGHITAADHLPNAYYTGHVPASGTPDYPAEDDVRNGVSYGGSLTGSCHVPTAAQVLDGVAVDATTGNVVLPAAGDVRNGTSFGPASSSTGTLTGGGESGINGTPILGMV